MPPTKGAAKGWLHAHPQVRTTLNAVWEMEPTELLELERLSDGRMVAGIRVAKGRVHISYAVLIKELLKLPELSDLNARVGSKDYQNLCGQVRSFFSHRRRTREQTRADYEKKREKKRARANYEREAEPQQKHKKQKHGIDMGPACRPYRPRQR